MQDKKEPSEYKVFIDGKEVTSEIVRAGIDKVIDRSDWMYPKFRSNGKSVREYLEWQTRYIASIEDPHKRKELELIVVNHNLQWVTDLTKEEVDAAYLIEDDLPEDDLAWVTISPERVLDGPEFSNEVNKMQAQIANSMVVASDLLAGNHGISPIATRREDHQDEEIVAPVAEAASTLTKTFIHQTAFGQYEQFVTDTRQLRLAFEEVRAFMNEAMEADGMMIRATEAINALSQIQDRMNVLTDIEQQHLQQKISTMLPANSPTAGWARRMKAEEEESLKHEEE